MPVYWDSWKLWPAVLACARTAIINEPAMSDKISDHLVKLPPVNINFTARTPFIPNKPRASRIAQNYTSQSSLDLILERDTYRNIPEEQHPSNGID